jgi:tetratricopeptide (TPR) repeat protein
MVASARAYLAATLLASTWLAAPPALAQAPSTEASVEARRELAKSRFQAGSAHYEAGEYRRAVVAFVEADRLAPSPALSFNIARAYERLDDTSGALRWYRDYLRRSPKAKNAAEVSAKVADLSAKLARSGQQQITVLSMPPGATVVVDGRAIGVTPFTGELSIGDHRVLLDLPGYREVKQDVSLTATAAQDLSMTLTALPSSQVSKSASPSPRPAASSSRFGAWTWVVGGAGIAGLSGALAFELGRRAEEDAARDAASHSQIEFKERHDDMTRDQVAARVLASVGGALIVGSAVMLLLDRREPEQPQVGLGCTLQSCSALAKGHF